MEKIESITNENIMKGNVHENANENNSENKIICDDKFKDLISLNIKNSLIEKINSLEIKFENDIKFIELLKYDFYDITKKYSLYSDPNYVPEVIVIQNLSDNLSIDKNIIKSADNKTTNSTAPQSNEKEAEANNKMIDSTKINKNNKTPIVNKKVDVKRSITPINVNKTKTVTKDKPIPAKTPLVANAKKNLNRSVIIESSNKLEKNDKISSAAKKGSTKKPEAKKEDKTFSSNATPTQNNLTQSHIRKSSITNSEINSEKIKSQISIERRNSISNKNENIRYSIKNEEMIVESEVKEKNENEVGNKIKEETSLLNQINNVIIIPEKIPTIVNFVGRQLPEDFNNSDTTTKALFLFVNSNFIDNKLKLLFYSTIPKIKNNLNFKSRLIENITKIEKILKSIDEEYGRYFNDQSITNLMNKKFSPSKTAQNGLTFVTKTEEENLGRKEQPEEIKNVFRLIYLILNEKMDEITPQKLIDNLFNNLLPKYKIDNISKKYFNLY